MLIGFFIPLFQRNNLFMPFFHIKKGCLDFPIQEEIQTASIFIRNQGNDQFSLTSQPNALAPRTAASASFN